MLDYNNLVIDKEIEFIISERSKRLEFVKNNLNEYLDKNYDKGFYNFILGDWLDTISNLSHSVWIDEINHETRYSGDFFNVPVKALDFRFLRIDKLFNAELYFIKNKFDFNKLSFKIFEKKIKKKKTFKDILLLLFKKYINYLSKKKVFYYSSYFLGSNFKYFKSFLSNQNYVYFPYLEDVCKENQIDKLWRKKKINSCQKPTDSFSFFKLLFYIYIPISLLENLSKNLEIANKSIEKHNPKFIVSSIDLQNNLMFKLKTYFQMKEGSKLVYIQHGGNYGIDKIHQYEKYEVDCSNTFVSWGWKSKDKKVLPISHPKLIKNYKLIKNKYLLLLGNYPSFPYRFHYQPMGNKRVKNMRKETFNFLKNVDSTKNLYVRTYQDYDGDFNPTIFKKFANFKIDNMQNVIKSFKSSEIVIHNYLCTSYLISLSLNVPTICFFDKEVYKFREEFNQISENFFNVGIFHDTAEKAANFLNNLNVEKWWLDKKTQNARHNFVQNYANFSDNWTNPWNYENE